MRDYDKKTENELARVFFGHLIGEFVQPITSNYPKPCSTLETMLYGFLTHFGKEKLMKLKDRGLVEFYRQEFQHSCTDSDTGKQCPCGIIIDPYVFKLHDVQVMVLWDHGYIAKSWWKWIRGKQVCYSRYRLKLFHSDNEPIDLDQFTDEKLSHLLIELQGRLDGELKAIEDKHKQEIELLLGKEKG